MRPANRYPRGKRALSGSPPRPRNSEPPKGILQYSALTEPRALYEQHVTEYKLVAADLWPTSDKSGRNDPVIGSERRWSRHFRPARPSWSEVGRTLARHALHVGRGLYSVGATAGRAVNTYGFRDCVEVPVL